MNAACHSCAVVIANADTSHLSDDAAARIAAVLDDLGPVTLGYETDGGFRCAVCGIDAIEGLTLETA